MSRQIIRTVVSVPARPRRWASRTRLGVFSCLVIVATLAVAGLAVGPAHSVAPVAVAGAQDGFTGPAESANARFVVASYRQLLGRTADTGGLDFHLSRITAGGDHSREAFARSLLFSREGSGAEVVRAYADLLGRGPEPAGGEYWTNHLRSHGVVDLRVLLVASDEYHRASGGTDEGWIDRLYREVLRREADPAGRSYWLAQLDIGVPRVLVAAGIQLSDEALGQRADAYYLEALSRIPSPGERAGAIYIIRAEGERGLRARLWASDEAFEPHLRAAVAGWSRP